MLIPSLKIGDLSSLNDSIPWFFNAVGENTVVAFYGELGAGKTTLIQALCRHLGVKQEVTSPTFAIVNEYSGSDSRIIYHFDFYRLDNPEEVLDIGFEDYISSGDLCLMEWPEKIESYLPPETIRLYIEPWSI